MRERERERERGPVSTISLVLQLVPSQFLFHPQEGWPASWSWVLFLTRSSFISFNSVVKLLL